MAQTQDDNENIITDDEEDEGDSDSNALKKLAVGLLIIASVLCGLLLLQSPAPAETGLTGLDQIDSLITRELSYFSIPPNRIRMSEVEAGGIFTRKTYFFEPPSGFARSWFHIELARKLNPMGISMYGTVEFPGRTLKLILLYEDKVIRTIHVQEPAEYDLPTYPARLMLVVDKRPGSVFTERVSSDLSSMSLVFRVQSAEDAVAMTAPFGPRTHFFWLDAGRDELPYLARSLRTITTRPRFVLMDAVQAGLRDQIMESAGRNSGWVDGRESVVINDQAGRARFEQELRAYLRDARAGQRDLALVHVSEQGLNWLADTLHDYRKGGMVLSLPTITLQ